LKLIENIVITKTVDLKINILTVSITFWY